MQELKIKQIVEKATIEMKRMVELEYGLEDDFSSFMHKRNLIDSQIIFYLIQFCG